jgi:hypothetical protein
MRALGLRQMGDDEPAVFCTLEFYDFEMMLTAVIHSAR